MNYQFLLLSAASLEASPLLGRSEVIAIDCSEEKSCSTGSGNEDVGL